MKQPSLATYLHWLEELFDAALERTDRAGGGQSGRIGRSVLLGGRVLRNRNSNGGGMQGEIVGFRDSTVLAMPLERPQGVRFGEIDRHLGSGALAARWARSCWAE